MKRIAGFLAVGILACGAWAQTQPAPTTSTQVQTKPGGSVAPAKPTAATAGTSSKPAAAIAMKPAAAAQPQAKPAAAPKPAVVPASAKPVPAAVKAHPAAAKPVAIPVMAASGKNAVAAPTKNPAPPIRQAMAPRPMIAAKVSGPKKELAKSYPAKRDPAKPIVAKKIVAKPAPKAPAQAIKAPEPPASPKPEEPKWAMNGKRDPFFSPVVQQSTGSGCSTGKKCLEIGQINVRGVVKSETGFIAVVTNSLNKAYFLHENDPVFNGYVMRITGDTVVFQETVQDKLGKPLTREVVKRITTPAV
jgi:Tfp pilus assembly protein PilP